MEIDYRGANQLIASRKTPEAARFLGAEYGTGTTAEAVAESLIAAGSRPPSRKVGMDAHPSQPRRAVVIRAADRNKFPALSGFAKNG
jgi:hypothetical protein